MKGIRHEMYLSNGENEDDILIQGVIRKKANGDIVAENVTCELYLSIFQDWREVGISFKDVTRLGENLIMHYLSSKDD